MPRLSRIGIALVTIAIAAGCSATSEEPDPAQAEGDYHSKPKGNDTQMASFVVKAPSTLGKVTLGTTTKAIGAVFSGLRPDQAASWTVKGKGKGIESSVPGKSGLAPNKTTEANLSAVRVKWGSPPKTYGLDASSVWTRRTPQGPQDYVEIPNNGATLWVWNLADGVDAVPVAPGHYGLAFGYYGDGAVLDAKPGAVTSVDLSSFAGRRTVRIVPAAAGDFPNACSGSSFLVNGTSRLELDVSSPIIVGQNPELLKMSALFVFPDAHGISHEPSPGLALVLPCSDSAYPLPLGAEGDPPKDLKLGRLDVDDVEVTLTNGTKELRPGKYSVGGNGYFAGPFPTKTGLDLPPGTYRLSVSYKNNLNQDAGYEETFTTP